MAEGKVRLADERKELSGLDAAGLAARLDEEKRRLWNARFTLGKRQLENTADIAKTRKRIARIHTYLRVLETKTNV